jgi:hypothetical protein
LPRDFFSYLPLRCFLSHLEKPRVGFFDLNCSLKRILPFLFDSKFLKAYNLFGQTAGTIIGGYHHEFKGAGCKKQQSNSQFDLWNYGICMRHARTLERDLRDHDPGGDRERYSSFLGFYGNA